MQNDYLTGRNEFEGDVRVTIGDFTCVHQVFGKWVHGKPPAGDTSQVEWKNVRFYRR